MWIVNDTGLGENASKKSKSAHGFVTGNWMAVIILQSLLDEPNPNSPANSLAAQLYQENKREYEKKVIAIVEQSWLNNWWPRHRGKLKRTLLIFASYFFPFHSSGLFLFPVLGNKGGVSRTVFGSANCHSINTVVMW